MKELDKHKDQIQVSTFLSDLSSFLVSYGIRGVSSHKMLSEVVRVCGENHEHLTAKSIENIVFFMERQKLKNYQNIRSQAQDLIASFVQRTIQEGMILKGEVRDHLLMLSLLTKFEMHVNPEFSELVGHLLKHIEAVFCK